MSKRKACDYLVRAIGYLEDSEKTAGVDDDSCSGSTLLLCMCAMSVDKFLSYVDDCGIPEMPDQKEFIARCDALVSCLKCVWDIDSRTSIPSSVRMSVRDMVSELSRRFVSAFADQLRDEMPPTISTDLEDVQLVKKYWMYLED